MISLEDECVFGWVCFHLSDCIEDILDLSGDDREYFDGNPVELIEASPSTSLGKAHEDLSH